MVVETVRRYDAPDVARHAVDTGRTWSHDISGQSTASRGTFGVGSSSRVMMRLGPRTGPVCLRWQSG